MIRSKVFTRVIAGLLILSVSGMMACDKHDAGPVTTADPPPEPDIIDDGGDTKASAWLAGNPWHEKRLEELLARPGVSAEVAALGWLGFELSPAESFTLTGGDASTEVSVTFITLRAPSGGDLADRTATIACYSAGDGSGLSSIETTTSPVRSGGGWRVLSDPVWYRATGPDRTDTSAMRVDWWDWGFLVDCLFTRAPAAAGGCAISCVVVPGYWHCFLICVGTQSLTATIACMTQMYQASKKVKEEI